MRERILCSAIHCMRYDVFVHQPVNINSGYVIAGLRHHNCFEILSRLDGEFDKTKIVQGFLTSKNRFVDRKEGFTIARCANQLLVKEPSWDKDTILCSENLY